MSLTLSAIREALAGQIRNNVARDVNVYAYKPSDPRFPCIAITGPSRIEYTRTFSGPSEVSEVDLNVEIHIVAFALDQQMALDDYLSAGSGNGSSVVDAIESDKTLGGAVEFVQVGTASGSSANPADPDPWVGVLPVTVSCLRGA